MEMQNKALRKWLSSDRKNGGQPLDYSRILRVIGQQLEARRISTCCLWAERDRFDIIGLSAGAPNAVVEAGFWQRLRAKPSAPGYSTLELSFTLDELLRLDEANQSKREISLPRSDFLTLSEQLRTVGAIVDRRGGQLIRVDRAAYDGMISSFSVQYKLPSGVLMTEEFSAPSLYDFSVQIFMMEKRRTGNNRAVSRAA